MGTRAKIDQLIRSFLGSDSTISTILSDFDSKTITVVKTAADGAAGDATTAYVVWLCPADCRITSVKYVTSGTVTAHDTNYATLTVAKADGAGGSPATVASVTTQITGGTGNIAANVPATVTLSATASNLELTAGNILTFAIEKASSGVVVPAGCVSITYKMT